MKPLIKNIYYMLAYVYKALRKNEYRKIETENFENLADLLSEILILGLNTQLKRGLFQEYVEKIEEISGIKGKMDLNESIKKQTLLKRRMICSFDEYSINSYFNKIIKSTMMLLLKLDITKQHKQNIRNLLDYFIDVDLISVHDIKWKFSFNKNNDTYIMLLAICNLIVKGLIQTQSEGTVKVLDYFSEQKMHKLYEKFILEYYKKEFPEIKADSSKIDWVLDDEYSYQLPTMQSDVMLSKGRKILIIDAKYYGQTMQNQYDTYTVHSNNLYQIFTYVKNKRMGKANLEYDVSGMLLYARTEELIQPNNTYSMSGNKISVRTLDLNCEFDEIKNQLNQIVEEYFEVD